MGTYQSKFTGAEIDGLLEQVQTGGAKKVTLWEGELGTENASVTLSDSIKNYDFIWIGSQIKDKNGTAGAQTTMLLDADSDKGNDNGGYNFYNSAGTSHWYRIGCKFTDNTTLLLTKATVSSTSWVDPHIYKVIGIKY